MSKLSEFASPPYCWNLKHKSTCMHYLSRNCVLSNLQQRNQLSKKVLNPFGLLPLAVLEQMIVFVSPSPPLNLSPAAEPHSLPPPARPRQHRAAGGGGRRQLSLSIRAKPTDLPQRQQSILAARSRTDIASPRTRRNLCRPGEERGCR